MSDESNDYNDLEVAAVLANATSAGVDHDTHSSSTSTSLVDYSPFTFSSSLTNSVHGTTCSDQVFDLLGTSSINNFAAKGELPALQQLLAAGEHCINAIDVHGKTPLMSAVGAGWSHVVEFLLKRGCDTNLIDQQGTTALMQACSLGSRSIVVLLLESDADINATSTSGDTALHYAVFGGHVECVQLLLEWGADVTVIDNNGFTPLELASELGYKDVQEIIYAHLLQALTK